MLSCFTTQAKHAISIEIVTVSGYADWLQRQTAFVKTWLRAFKNEAGKIWLIPDDKGQIVQALICIEDNHVFWGIAGLALQLPEGVYEIVNASTEQLLAWGLGSYQFTRYKVAKRKPAQLKITSKAYTQIAPVLESIFLVRDLINVPTDDMGPSQLLQVALQLAKEFSANCAAIVGEALLKANYPAIYTVGRASDDPPCLIDLRWGNVKHPNVTLVGKGVCFDTGGLNIKNSPAMALMKKDMAGAAHVLGLARMIMATQLPVRLRVLIPAVENVIAGNAYRPGDVIKSRQGTTIEIGNTDAEGRVILADALAEAVSEKPELLIDITTLTGAARIALGTDLPVLFTNDDQLANDVIKAGNATNDPMWRLPLYEPYRELLQSNIADINNCSPEPYAGAITAALFLKEFVGNDVPWLHFDLMAWNLRSRPGRPAGGESMTLRALFHYLQQRYH